MDRILKSILSETPRGREYLAAQTKAKRDASARRRSRSPRASGATRADRKAAKREETARLRGELILLSGEMCERCGVYVPPHLGHMHHTRGGSGRRLAEQSIENVAWLCPDCHGLLHRTPALAREFRVDLANRRAGRAAYRPTCQYGATVCTHEQCRRTP